MRIKIALAALAATVAFAYPAMAQTVDNAPAQARGVVLLPLTISEVDPLNFGTVLASATAGTVTAAQNVVVIQAEVGTAGAIARALDRTRHPLVVGTLAGDDTCLVIAPDAAAAAELARELG